MENIVLPDISRLSYDPKKHAYKLDGSSHLTGVTSVLSGTSDKSALINWSANVAVDYVKENSPFMEYGLAEVDDHYEVPTAVLEAARTAHTKKKEAAGTKGTDAHALVEQYVLECLATNEGKPVSTVLSPVQPFVDWAHTEVEFFVAAEQKLFDEENAVAGTADFFYVSKTGEFVAGDLKTFPKMWSPDAYCQTGQYARMWRLLTGLQATKSVVVKMCDPEDLRLKKYGGLPFAVYSRYALQEDEEMFLKRLDVYRYNQNFTSPKE